MTNYIIPLKPFYFIRHGQTDWNREHRLMGQNDIPLNQNGVNQAQEAASYFKNSSHPIEKIISSPLLRAKKTAEIISNTIGTQLVYHDGLKEVSFGVAEGELEGYENLHSSWVKGITPKGAESWIEFQHRILTSMISLLNNDESRIPLIVSHGGVYAAIMDYFGHPNHNADNCVPYFFTPPSSPDQGWSILNLVSKKTLSCEISTYEDLHNNQILQSTRLIFRPFRQEDLNLLHQLHSNIEVAKTTIDGVQNIETVKNHLNNFINHQEELGFSQWAVFKKESLKFIGRAGFTKRTLNQKIGEHVEMRFALLPEFWNQGYASEITQELINFAFEKLKLKTIAAAHGVSNDKSKRVLTKNGFQYVDTILLDGFGADSTTKFYVNPSRA